MSEKIAFMLLSILCLSCSAQDPTEVPQHVKNLDSLTVYPLDMEPAASIQLVREVSFGDTKDVLIGSMGGTAIDNLGRVFSYDYQQNTIHAFNHDGSYLTNLGREGQGPGEFLYSASLSIVSDQLYAFDARALRVNIYSLEPLEFSHTINLNPIQQDSVIKKLTDSYYSLSGIMARNKSTLLALFRQTHNLIPGEINNEQKIKYFILDKEGNIVSDKIFEQLDWQWIGATVGGEFKDAAFEFLGKSLMAVSDDGHIFSGWTKDFLIEVRDPNGEYLRAFYHPYRKKEFTRNDAIHSLDREYGIDVLQNAKSGDLPEFWPVLNDMQIDDENRLWITTIVDDNEVYEWWVLDDYGELLAKFTWPRDRRIAAIKNGYVYARETDEMDFTRIVRYKVEMVET